MDLDQLYRRYFTSVYRYIFSSNSFPLPEITQETFFRVSKKHSSFTRGSECQGCSFVKLLEYLTLLISNRIIVSVSLNSDESDNLVDESVIESYPKAKNSQRISKRKSIL